MPIVIIADIDLESYFQAVMQHLDAKYHQFPTSFQDFTLTDEQERDLLNITAYANMDANLLAGEDLG